VTITQLKDCERPLFERLNIIIDEKANKTDKSSIQKRYKPFTEHDLKKIDNFSNWIILNCYIYDGYMWEAIRHDYIASKQFSIAFLTDETTPAKMYGLDYNKIVEYHYVEYKFNYKLMKFTPINKTKLEVVNGE
jgi:hypothetical protein